MKLDRIQRPMEILMVEDNPDDVELMRLALREGRGEHNLNVAKDGVEAMAFLRREGDYGAAPRPDLILLDLNLPRKDGREVLAEVKNDEALQEIPVIVLTSSRAPEDVLKVYSLHANCYIAKPVDFQEFIRVAKSIEDFWFGIAKLPDSRPSESTTRRQV